MPEPPHTDRKKLMKGVRFLVGSLPLAFLGPVIIYNAYGKNQDKPLFWPVLIIGILLAVAAAYCMFKGIQTIVSAFFDHEKKN